MAMAERNLEARFGSKSQNHHTYVIAGDGCLMEGINHEAASLAGHLALGRLTCIFDDNHITIDGPTSLSTDDDVGARFESYGWEVVDLGEIADDLDAMEVALKASRKQTDKPTLLMLRSHIADPSPDYIDTSAAHGNPFSAEDVARVKTVMGIPDEPFWAPDDLVGAYRSDAAQRGAAARSNWVDATRDVTSSPEWRAAWNDTGLEGWDDDLPTYEMGDSVATRKAINKALDATYDMIPGLISGSADLSGSNGTTLARTNSFTATDPGGRYIHYGVREHAMGAAMVGMALHGGVLPISGTFFVFSDYMRPAIRLAALSSAKVCFVFTHDSVGVGEDGPTHQPVEHLAALRAIPDLHVLRPADANETIQAWADVVRHNGPSALILSRQNIRVTTDGSAVARGAGIVVDADGLAQIILIGTGSEVEVCVDAAALLAESGVATRVVSMPSWDRFAAQDADYREGILPANVPTLSVEAAVTFGWERYADSTIGIDRFGASAPGAMVLDRFGINADHVVDRAKALLN
jgi:transketolase